MVKRYYIQHYPKYFRGNIARDRSNSLGFHQAVNQEQSNQTSEKTYRSDMWTCGEGRRLFTSCQLEQSQKIAVSVPKRVIWKLLIFSMLYDEVFMLFLLPALSQVATHTTHHNAHQQTDKEVSLVFRFSSQLPSQLDIVPTVGNRPRNSKKQHHRRHKNLSLAMYRLLNRIGKQGDIPS